MRYRALLPRLYSAPTTFGRRQLRSSAAWQTWQMTRINESVALLSSLGVPPLVVHRAMDSKCIISLASALRRLMQYDSLWSEGTTLSLPTDDASQMFYGECSGPH
jgi:hypothetical protein